MSSKECEEFKQRASKCPKATPYYGISQAHEWIVISKTIAQSSESVSTLMCGVCLYMMEMPDVYRYLDCSNVRPDHDIV